MYRAIFSLASFREIPLFGRQSQDVGRPVSRVEHNESFVGVGHHSRLDITQLFIARTSAGRRCFFVEIIRRFPGDGYLRRSPGIVVARACLSRQLVKLKQRARENRRGLETARGSS